MPSLNRCMFIGNLGRDPEMRYTNSGRAVTQFSLAVNRHYKDSNDEWQEQTEWVSCVVWGDSGERAAEQLRKGNLVYVEGRAETQSWTDQETGKKVYRVVYIISQWQNLTKREGERVDVLDRVIENDETRSMGPGDPNWQRGGRQPVAAAAGAPADDLDDLPF